MEYGLSIDRSILRLGRLGAVIITCLVLALAPLVVYFSASASTIDDILVKSGPSSGGTTTPFSGEITQSLQQQKYQKIVSGGFHTLGLTADGKVYAWGLNHRGQLGNNSTENSDTPVAVDTSTALAGKTIVDIGTGYYSSYAIADDGTAYAWGDNGDGQLGDDSWTNQYTPVAIDMSGDLAGKSFVQIDSGYGHSVGLTSDGTVYTWGVNWEGQLGDDHLRTDHNSPLPVDTSSLMNSKTITRVTAGQYHTVALASDGTIFAWGDNYRGGLGDGTETGRSSPVTVDASGVLAGKTIVDIQAGDYGTVALSSDGQVFTWGQNANSELGDGSTVSGSLLPVAVDMSGALAGKTVTQISRGVMHASVVASDGRVYGWGFNGVGELGVGPASAEEYNVPVAANISGVLAGKTIVEVTSGEIHTAALDSDGNVYSWGYNGNGELGVDHPNSSPSPTSIDTSGVLAGQTITQIATGSTYGLALSDSGQTYAWGGSASGAIGDGTVEERTSPVDITNSGAMAGKTVTQIAASDSSSYALTSDGQIYAWGYNNNGQLGDGSTTNRLEPVAVDMTGAMAGKTVTQIAAGSMYALALTSDGQIYAWGYNNNGQLGDGSTTRRLTPVLVTMSGVLAGKTVTQVSAGGNFSMALTADGLAYTWGSNGAGQLGDGSASSRSLVPVAVNTSGVLAGKTVVDISAGSTHALVRTSDGLVYGWGSNNRGQLGNASNTSSPVPVAVDTSGVLAGKTVGYIEADNNLSYAIADGQAYAWGWNDARRYGTGDLVSSNVPVIAANTGSLDSVSVQAIMSGSRYAAALSQDGQIFTWGDNGFGQLGTGGLRESFDPVVTNLPFSMTAPTTPTVTFDGLAATSVELVDDGSGDLFLRAVTPAHAPGPVDVVITFEGQAPITLPLAYTYLADDSGSDPISPDPGDSDEDPDTDPSPSDSATDGLADSGSSVWLLAVSALVTLASGSYIIWRRP